MTYAAYLETVGWHLRQHPTLRWGQAHFNVLHDVHPDLSARVHNTELDPFYLDERIPQFLAFVSSNWDTP